MKRAFLVVLTSIICFSSCAESKDPLRNNMVFKNHPLVVEFAIIEMERLLGKLPQAEVINYFTDDDGNLYINNKNLGSLSSVMTNTQMRKDEVFDEFSNDEYRRFFVLVILLLENDIDSGYKSGLLNKFFYGYRRTFENQYNDLREIIIVGNIMDTTNTDFRKNYQVIDSNGKLALVAPGDISIE